jgi:ferredoxin
MQLAFKQVFRDELKDFCNNLHMDTLIIGSGLSALAIYKALADLGEGDEIYLIDTNTRHKNTPEKLSSGSAQKNLFGSGHMYETIMFDGSESSSLSFSRAAGGLSTVWGAGIRLWDPSIIKELHVGSDKFYVSAKHLLSEVPYFGDNESLNIPLHIPVDQISPPYQSKSFSRTVRNQLDDQVKYFDTPLAVSTQGANSCVGCGLCLTGCPYGSIFNAANYFDRLLIEQKLNRIQGKVSQLNQVHDRVEVTFENESLHKEVRIFDRAIVCAGAIGTPIILMKSSTFLK